MSPCLLTWRKLLTLCVREGTSTLPGNTRQWWASETSCGEACPFHLLCAESVACEAPLFFFLTSSSRHGAPATIPNSITITCFLANKAHVHQRALRPLHNTRQICASPTPRQHHMDRYFRQTVPRLPEIKLHHIPLWAVFLFPPTSLLLIVPQIAVYP